MEMKKPGIYESFAVRGLVAAAVLGLAKKKKEKNVVLASSGISEYLGLFSDKIVFFYYIFKKHPKYQFGTFSTFFSSKNYFFFRWIAC